MVNRVEVDNKLDEMGGGNREVEFGLEVRKERRRGMLCPGWDAVTRSEFETPTYFKLISYTNFQDGR